MTKTIAFLLADFQSGGTEWFALRLARGLAAQNIDSRGMSKENTKPIFLVLRAEGDLLPLIDSSIEIISLNGTGYTFFKTLRTLPAMIRFLNTHQPDAVFGGLTILNIVASLAILMAKTKTCFIAIEHMRLGQPTASLWGNVKRAIKIFLVRLSYLRADEVVAVSQAAKTDLINLAKINANKLRIIHNPIIPDNLDALCQAPPPHAWLANKQTSVILGIGRLLANKDFANLIHAFANAAPTTDARLIIFGQGEEQQNLTQLITELGLEERITLAGQIDNVFSALHAADLFVLPSRSEAFGNVIVEALACGCPVISTDCGGPREILDNGNLGTLVPPNDPDAMARAIINGLTFPTAQEKDKEQRITHGKSFDVSTAVQKYLALLE